MRSTYGDRGGWGGGTNPFAPFSLTSIPVVRGCLFAVVAVFFLAFAVVPLQSVLPEWLIFRAGPGTGLDALLRPWAVVTYPLVVGSFGGVVWQGYWLYMVGGTLERSWGSRNFAALLAIFTAFSAVAFIPAALLFQVPVILAGLMLPLSSLTVAWAAMDPNLEIKFWGLVPVKLKWIALIDVLSVYFYFGFQMPGPLRSLLALFSLAGPAAAWYYVRKMPRLNLGFRPPRPAASRDGGRFRDLLRDEPPPREQVSRPGLLRKRQEQQEIERLKKLLGEDDDRPRRR